VEDGCGGRGRVGGGSMFQGIHHGTEIHDSCGKYAGSLIAPAAEAPFSKSRLTYC